MTAAGPPRRRARQSWIPPAVALAGLLASLLAWTALLDARRAAAGRAAAAELASVSGVVRATLGERLEALRRVARRWEAQGSRTRTEFDLEAEVLRESYPSFRAVGWVGPDLRVRWVHPEAGNEAALGLDVNAEPTRAAAYARAASEGTAYTRPIPLVQGGRGALGIARIGDGAARGYAYAAIDLESLLGRAFRDVGGVAAVAVTADGEAAFRAGPWRAEAAVAATIEIGGVRWGVSVAAPAPDHRLPHLVLALGAALSAMLGLALRGGMRSAASAAALARGEASYRALFETVPVGVVLLRPDDMRAAACNDRFARMLEREREDVVGMSPYDWDVGLPHERIAALGRRATSGSWVNDFETSWRTASGAVVDVHVTGAAVAIDGSPYLSAPAWT